MKFNAPASPVRLLALDLDGTLLRSDRTIGARSVAALHAAHRRGVEIVLASGRMTAAMESTAALLGLDVSIVSYNGAAACSHRADGRRRLFHLPLDAAVAGELVRYARARKLQVNFYHEEMVVSEDGPQLRPWIELYRERTGSPFRFVPSLEAYVGYAPTKLLYCVDPARRDAIHDDLRAAYEARAAIVHTDPEYLEFLNPAADKGVGLAHLADKFGIPLEQCMAIGDGENDIPMLQAAGWPVAVANAKPPCRAAARFVTAADHEHDGVGEAVERWVL